jgi:hypothetical protein
MDLDGAAEPCFWNARRSRSRVRGRGCRAGRTRRAADHARNYFDTVEALGFYVEAVVPPARMPLFEFTL